MRSIGAGLYVPDEDDEEPTTWRVIDGTGVYAAVIETEPGSSGGEGELAPKLARAVGATVYAIGFSGYDDPDDGLPFIEAHDGDESTLIWMAETFDDEIPQPETVAGPEGIPCDDPFAFAEALGCPLRQYY